MCSTERVTFFPPDPAPDRPEIDDEPPVRMPWWNAPSDEIPALVPVTRVLAVTPHVAISLIGVHVYGDGLELQVYRRLRRGDLGRDEWSDLTGKFTEHWPGGQAGSGRLRYGAELASGDHVIAGQPGFDIDMSGSPARRPSLAQGGGNGNGDGHTYAMSDLLWLWPLPPDGALDIVVQWTALGIAETRTALEPTRYSELAARSTKLWP